MGEPLIKGPEPNRERVDALWASAAPFVLVRERKKRAQRRIAGATVAVLVVAVSAALYPKNEAIEQTGALATADNAPSSFLLADGSRVEADPEARVAVERIDEEEVRVEMGRGKAFFAVAKKKRRLFSVHAADVTIRVVGTRFSVARSGAKVNVEVEEGIVEVRHGDKISRLVANERWTNEPAVVTAPVVAPVVEPAVAERPAPRDAKRRSAARKGPVADALFQEAMSARQAGDHPGARKALAELIAAFPRDRRLALASFELGRLEMDDGHDLGAAVVALTRALTAAPQASFAEDALARLARAQAARGERTACQKAKKLYAERYPTGAYAASLAPICP